MPLVIISSPRFSVLPSRRQGRVRIPLWVQHRRAASFEYRHPSVFAAAVQFIFFQAECRRADSSIEIGGAAAWIAGVCSAGTCLEAPRRRPP